MNESQYNAVTEIRNNSIILACPGSGKTFTLISKIVHLINDNKVSPDRIILITFTKKTAIELTERLNKVMPDKRLLHIGTVHSLAFKTIQMYVDNKTVIIDEDDMSEVIDEIMMEDDDCTVETGSIINILDEIVNSYPIELYDVLKKAKKLEQYDEYDKVLTKYKLYKSENKLLDYGDIMLQFMEFLKTDKSDTFKKSYDYILFDEYQDINNIQDLILKEMNSFCNNLTVVGDDAQAIYKFRGSSVKFILEFQQVYKDVKQFILNQNYRCSPEIIDFCNDLISHNNVQLRRTMVPIKENTNLKPYIHGFTTILEEAKFIVRRILQSNKSYKEQVVLARNNKQLDIYELLLLQNGTVPYCRNKGASILERVHVKKYINFIKNHDNEENFHELCEQFIRDNFIEETDKRCIEDIRLITEYLFNEHTNLIQVSNQDSTQNSTQNSTQDSNKLLLSTVHSSKGLEWDTVYVVGVSSDLMPYIVSNSDYLNQIETVEEERRLFYVACTRAKTMLFITMSYEFHRFSNGLTNLIYTSPFIKDIDSNKYYGINLRFPIRNRSGCNVIQEYLCDKSTKDVYNLLSLLKYSFKRVYKPTVQLKREHMYFYTEFIKSITMKVINQNWLTEIHNLFNRACIRMKKTVDREELFTCIMNEPHFKFYKQIEQMMIEIVDNNKCIIDLQMENADRVYIKADMICNKQLIKIVPSFDSEVCDTKNIINLILCRYLLRTHMKYNIETVVIINPILGEIFTVPIKGVWKGTNELYHKVIKVL